MRSKLRLSVLLLGVSSILLLAVTAVPCHAQGFGIGVRMSMVKSDTDSDVDVDAVRFIGGQIRMRTSPRTGIEVSLDRHTEEFDVLDQRVREYPLQASLMLFPVHGAFSPYVLGGPGWYTTKVDTLSIEDDDSVSTRRFGWHAGFGAELLMGKHAGLHADYRYTFLKFGGDDDDDDDDLTGAQSRHSLFGSILPAHGGSMWTAGVTVYF
jgi:opacity protein-like surface antigen